MTRVHAEAVKSISIVAEDNILKSIRKEVNKVLEYDECRIELQNMEDNIKDLRDAL